MSPVVAHNITWLLAYLLNGLGAAVLCARFVERPGAILAGSLAFAFSFYVQLHTAGHLHLIWLWPLPLSLWQLMRWFDRPSLGRLWPWTALVAVHALTSWYLAVMTVLANGLVAVVLLGTARDSATM